MFAENLKMASKSGDTRGITCMYRVCCNKEDKLTPSSARIEIKSYVPDEKVFLHLNPFKGARWCSS